MDRRPGRPFGQDAPRPLLGSGRPGDGETVVGDSKNHSYLAALDIAYIVRLAETIAYIVRSVRRTYKTVFFNFPLKFLAVGRLMQPTMFISQFDLTRYNLP